MPWAAQSIRPITRVDALKAPRESWWLCADEDFSTKAADEWRRMKTSKFGSMQLGTSAADAKIARRRQLPV